MSSIVAVIGARERFLNDASVILSGSCGALSDNLRLDAQALRGYGGSTTPRSRAQCCLACGSQNLQEREVVSSNREVSKTVSLISDTKQEPGQTLLILKCQICKRTTKRRVKAPSRQATTPKQRFENSESDHRIAAFTESASSAAPSLAGTGAKSSSKKRAKQRKDREGLKAMLDKNKTSTNTLSGFSLMDFMSGAPK